MDAFETWTFILRSVVKVNYSYAVELSVYKTCFHMLLNYPFITLFFILNKDDKISEYIPFLIFFHILQNHKWNDLSLKGDIKYCNFA